MDKNDIRKLERTRSNLIKKESQGWHKLNIAKLDEYLKMLKNLSQSEAEDRINRDLEQIKRKESLATIVGGEELNDFEKIFKEYFTNEIKYINKAGQTGKLSNSKLTGFHSSLTPQQIKTLFAQLKGIYIDENTNESHFKAIFSNTILPKDFIKLKWLKPFSKILLAYFINKLFYKDNPFNYWSTAENLFDNSTNLRTSLGNNPYPKRHEEIDSILKNI